MKACFPHAASWFVLLAALAALASCGGGGGGGGGGGPGTPSPTPIALSAANQNAVTEDVLNMSLSFVGVGASNSSVGEVPLSAQPNTRPATHLLFGVLRQHLGSPSARSPQSAALVPLDTIPCDNAPNGSITTNPQATSNTVTFTNCLDAASGETINGTLALTNIANPAAGETTGHVSHNLTFTQPSTDTLMSSGEFDIDHKTAGTVVTDTLTGGPITVQIGGDVAILSGFTITSIVETAPGGGETDSVAGTIATTRIGGSVSVTTPTPLQTVSGRMFPSTGQIIITGASNSKLRLTVLGDETLGNTQVTLELDPGNGTFGAPIDTTWADL
jgi:hypothetical protein